MADSKITALTELTAPAFEDMGETVDDPSGTPASRKVKNARLLGLANKAHIQGLIVTKNSGGNTLDISAGECYDPSTSQIITYAGATAVSAGTLGASQWNQVYIYDNAGTSTIEVANNADPPSSAYLGSARKGGTGGERRWIGSFLTNGSSSIVDMDVQEIAPGAVQVAYKATTTSAPFRILNGVTTPTSFGAETSLVGCIPRYAAFEALFSMQLDVTSGSATVILEMSLDGTNGNGIGFGTHVSATGIFPRTAQWCPIRRSTPGIHYLVSGTNRSVYLDVRGYKFAR